MYTFGILALFFILLSGAIFGKRIKQNQFAVVLLVLAGTLIGTTIVNGVLGLKIPLTEVEVRTINLEEQKSDIYTLTDTMIFLSYVEYNYKMDEDSSMEYHNVDICLWNDVYSSDQDMLTVEFLPEGDSIPYVKILKEKRITDNKWITPYGLSGGDKRYIAYVPNDSIHNILINQLNEKFFTNEKESQIAKFD